MPQKPADILGRRFLLDIEVDQTITVMTQATIAEIAIKREKCGPVQLMQESN